MVNIKEIFDRFNINNIEINSKNVKNNTAFFAIDGIKSDGTMYIKDAISNGASLIFIHDQKYNREIVKDSELFKKMIPYKNLMIAVQDIRYILIKSLNFLYKQPKNICAVTGTNGKTSTVSYFYQLCKILRINGAAIGTNGIYTTNDLFTEKINKTFNLKNMTTPDIVTIHKILHMMVVESNIEYVAFEASSHGIDQGRIGGINLKSATITNITQEHLDYHGSFEEYKEAKLKLFSYYLSNEGVAISDISLLNDLKQVCDKRIISVGSNAELDITEISNMAYKQYVKFKYQDKEYEFETKIVGEFQIYNILFAMLALFICKDHSIDRLVPLLNHLEAPEGRLQKILNTNFAIFLDYAHTPDALESVLTTLARVKHVNGRLIVLFGAGGDRDKSKRNIMGHIASNIADICIITDDNPRTEDPELIRKEIISGCIKPNYIEINSRFEAIKYAVNLITTNDILLIAGKGHEKYQILNNKTIDFNEKEIVESLLTK